MSITLPEKGHKKGPGKIRSLLLTMIYLDFSAFLAALALALASCAFLASALAASAAVSLEEMDHLASSMRT